MYHVASNFPVDGATTAPAVHQQLYMRLLTAVAVRRHYVPRKNPNLSGLKDLTGLKLQQK